MDFSDICFNCFQARGGYEVCPFCGHVAATPNKPDYLLQPGMRLWGRYLVGTVLGIGGFGVTYKAWDTRLAAAVAIKEFFPQNLCSRMPGETRLRAFSGKDSEAFKLQLARFLAEAKSLAAFAGDAHIVNVLDYFEDNGSAYIVMEYLDGETLKQHLAGRGGLLPAAEAAGIMEGLLRALETVHKKGVIHRDISPDNLFILRDGRMKVLDFGAARFAAREDWTQSVVVKKGYAPPEQYRSNMKQGVWTDIYAAGATWYKMLCGKTPEESIERWEKDTLLRPSQLGGEADEGTDRAVMKAMALRPELRFKSAAAMLAVLKGEAAADFPEIELKKRRRRQAAAVAVTAAAVVAALGIAGWQLGQNPGIIQAGPTLADLDIAPDSITVLAQHSDYEGDTTVAMFNEMAAAFMEAYPEHQVTVDARTYEDLEANPPDYTAEGAATVFPAYYGNADDCRQDLTPLTAGLAGGDYYMIGEIKDSYGDTGEVLEVPMGLTFYYAFGSPSQAAESGTALPETLTSFTQILDIAEAAPLGGNLDFYEATELLTWYNPGGYRGGEYNPALWEEEMRRYVTLRATNLDPVKYLGENYYDSYSNERYLEIAQVYGGYGPADMRRDLGADAALIPIEKDGALDGWLTDSFCVNSSVSENKQRVGMLFLHFMLSEYGQALYHVQNDNAMPLNRNAMRQYLAVNPDFAVLENKFDSLDGSGGYIPNELHEQLRTMLDYNVRSVDVDEVMRVFMEYEPTEED